MISSVNDLLDKPFRQFTEEEQHEIIKQGRFTDLTNLCQNDKGKYRVFTAEWYKRIKWLTCDSVNKRLYCWPCVLFPSGSSRIWNRLGYDDLKNLSQSTRKHEETKEHTYSTIKLKILMTSKRRAYNRQQNQIENNVRIKRNRQYLERLIDIASALAHFQIPFRRTNEDGFYKYLLNIFKKYDNIVSTRLEEDNQFKGFTETIQIDLVNSIAEIVKQKIIDEVNEADFFAIQVDEVTSLKMCRQIALSVRYVRNNKPIERLIGVYEVPFTRKAVHVTEVLEKELDKLNFKEKLVAQSYGGGVVLYTELYNLQQSIKNLQGIKSRCLMMHSHAHDFCDILIQSLRSIHECKLFFSIIELFATFFNNIALTEFLPNVPVTWTNSVYSCIQTIHEHNVSLIEVLNFINSAEEYQNSPKVISDTINLIFHLRSFKFVMCTHLFKELFSLVIGSMNIIHKNTYDTANCRTEINYLIDKLKRKKLEIVFKSLISTVQLATGQKVIATGLFQLYTQILDNIISEIEGRFLDVELTEFFALLDIDNISDHPEGRRNHNNTYLSIVKETYCNFLNVNKLRNELDLLFNDPSIVGIEEDIAIKKFSEIMQFMYDHEVNNYLPNLYKFMALIVTMSSFSEPLKGKDCVLNRIKEYYKEEKHEEPKSSLALLTIERELFSHLEKTEDWYEKVITCFSRLPSTSSIELSYETIENAEILQESPGKVEIFESVIDIKTEPDFDH